MNSDNTKHPLEPEVDEHGLTPSAAKLKRILGVSPAPRMLTPYEVELLRKAAQEADEVVGRVLARKTGMRKEDQ